jgi:hypothetical protein
MFFRAKRALRRAWFDFNCRALLSTPPLHSTDDQLTLVSMVCHGEVLMYLLAVKSFCTQTGRSPRFVVLNDGSFTPTDQANIRAHLPEARIVTFAEVAPANTPKGSCWERLLLISDIARDSYVVQIDSDTLTFNPIPEVLACIDANRSFTLLGDRSYPHIEPMAEACLRSKSNLDSMVQAVCERSFDQLPESASLLYLRGNAGFTGFAKGSLDRQKIEYFSDLMRRLAKEKWNDWGSEQITSNLLIANSPDATPLPAPRYTSYWAHPDVPYDASSFIHFIGPFRYANGLYLRKAKAIIAILRKNQQREKSS